MAVILNASTSSGLVQTADTSGELVLQNNGTTRLTVDASGVTIPTLTTTTVTGTIVQGTAVASTSGTSIDFTGIPSWVKRVTIMLSGVSTNGTSNLLCRIGSGSFTTSGYASGAFAANSVNAGSTDGFLLTGDTVAADLHHGHVVITNLSSNTYLASGVLGQSVNPASTGGASVSGGTSPNLAGTLDRIRITTVNGTDTFDAGSINIQYEG
jgi:hypothetical protein